MLKARRSPASFRRDTASVAALEFALVLPIMLALLAGVYDLSEAAIVRAEVYNAAEAMAASASSLAVQTDGSTALTYAQVQQVESTIWALMPTLRDGQQTGNPKSVTISSVLFYPNFATSCGFHQATPCQFNADIVWSVAYTPTVPTGTNATFQSNLPSNCTTVYGAGAASSDQVSPTTTESGTNNLAYFRTLNIATSTATTNGYPANEAGVPPILAVTIQYTYTPVFSLFLAQPFTFWVDGYWPVRSVKTTTAGTVSGNGNTDILPPLSMQYTTLVGTAPSGPVEGSPPAGSTCLNTSTNPVSNPVQG